MRQPVSLGGIDIPVSASVGTATGDPRVVDVHELIRRADAAMYLAKLPGGGRHTHAAAPTKPAAPSAPTSAAG
jgi:GGDEF domain-containing protein